MKLLGLIFLCASFANANSEKLPNHIKMTCNPRTSAYECLLCNCYHESRGEPPEDMAAVAKVVLSRSESEVFGKKSVCKVIYADRQFSWTQDRNPNNISTNSPVEIAAFNVCKSTMKSALAEGANNVLFYYNPSKAKPYWAKKFKSCGKVKNHIFLTFKDLDCPKNLGLIGSSHTTNRAQDKKSSSRRGVK